MKYNFDKIIERYGTSSLKYDSHEQFGIPKTALPLWVADMDFQIPPEATEAIMDYAKHGIYGYTSVDLDYNQAIIDWFARYFEFESKAEWIVQTPGVVYALVQAIRAYTNEGDAVMIQTPVYRPFMSVVKSNNRKLVENPLVYDEVSNRYVIAFDDLVKKIKENNVRIFILCSPHNPVSRVWSMEELREIADICRRYDCLVISDEIHSDLIFEGHKHHMFPDLDNCIICTAPSKTFNLAGLQNANIFIANEELRTKFQRELHSSGYGELNTMGLIACKAVYRHGHQWLKELIEYLQGNFDYLDAYLANTQIKVQKPEGTYLIWLDFRKYGLSDEDLNDTLLKAGVWLNKGTFFGTGGEGFMRINIACPRSTLEEALRRIGNIKWRA